MALASVAGIAPRGFFIPYRHAGAVAPPGALPPYAAIERLFDERAAAFRETLERIDSVAPSLCAIGGEPPPAPRWDQGWFAPLDAAAAYAMVRGFAPARIVEVGSGHSTRFLDRAVRDAGLSTVITAIDPEPRASIEGLEIELLRVPVQDADPAVFAALGPGDVLFVDSSHILMPGTDVDLLLNRVWPALPAGALMHVHDVFLPDGYPADWTWRGYNEQLAVAAVLTAGGAEALFASHYVASRMAGEVAKTVVARLPRFAGAPDSSLWLRKAASAAVSAP